MSKILVVGAAHLDIVGDFDSTVSNMLDKPGEIIYSVGGTGYNVAANLAQDNIEVTLLTSLRAESLITPIIASRLKSYKIEDQIILKEGLNESGFIAQRENGKLNSAVTASSLDHLLMTDLSDIEKLVSLSSMVICDCNLSSAILNKVSQICNTFDKKLCVACVSEAKARRVLEIDREEGQGPPIFILSLNQREAEFLDIHLVPEITRTEIIDICARFGSENIIVTFGSEGFKVVNDSGKIFSFEAPLVPKIVSHTGAGDALFAAVCSYYHRNKRLNWTEITKVISRFVGEVLKHRGATVGAITFPNELSVVSKKEYDELKKAFDQSKLSIYERISFNSSSTRIGAIVALLSLLVAALTFAFGTIDKMPLFIQTWYHGSSQ